MKYSNYSAFEKHLESAAPDHFADLYLIMSKEYFVRKQAIECLTALALKGKRQSTSLQTFDAEKHPVETILQELETFSLFEMKRLIIVENADAFEKAATVKLENYFAAPNRTICLVLAASAINRATTFYKKAEKTGIVLDIAEEKPWEKEKSVAEWLAGEAKKQGKQISAQICQQIVKQLGTDQSLLQSELLKLICYVGTKPSIEDKDVRAVCTSINQDNAWQLGEALFRRDAASALSISKALLAEGTALIALLRQIRAQFQTEYQVCSIITNGGGAAEVAQQFPYMKGQILERHMRQAQNYGMERFKKGICTIDETELQAKNSSTDPELLSDILMIKLTI